MIQVQVGHRVISALALVIMMVASNTVTISVRMIQTVHKSQASTIHRCIMHDTQLVLV
jgi:hypothetical protein